MKFWFLEMKYGKKEFKNEYFRLYLILGFSGYSFQVKLTCQWWPYMFLLENVSP